MAAATKTKARAKSASKMDWRAPRLKGKTFCFAGTLQHGDRATITTLVESEGGSVVNSVTAAVDYLVVGQTRGSGPSSAEKKAQLLNQKGAAIQVLDEAGLHALLAPDREMAIEMLKAGADGIARWNALCSALSLRARVDLSGADFRNCDLSCASLRHVHADVDGCDFRGAKLGGVCIDRISGAKFDRAGGAIRFSEARDCSFHRYQFGKMAQRMYGTVLSNCDLTGAQLAGRLMHAEFNGCNLNQLEARDACLDGCRFSACTFERANLASASLIGCDVTAADLSRANLSCANLESATLARANLSKADLRNARLIDADLTNAVIDGANFTGAQLAGVNVSTLDASCAKGLAEAIAAIPVVTIGPNVLELERVATQSQKIETSIELELPGASCEVRFQTYGHSQWVSTNISKTDDEHRRAGHQSSVSAAMSDLAKHCPGARLKFNTLAVSASKAPVKGKALKDLCLAAWCEVFGQPVPSAEDLQELARADKAGQQELREALMAELKGGAKGVARWNKRPERERRQASPFRGLDLAGLTLEGVDFEGLDFQNTNFAGANLQKANCRLADLKKATLDNVEAGGAGFEYGKLNDASCREAVLRKANLRGTMLLRTCFQGADLSGARLEHATLSGADFRNADLSGAKFDGTKFDESTIFPEGSSLPDGLIWAGKGKDPRLVQKVAEVQQSGPVDFDAFMQKLEESFDASRLDKAVKMLKAERFQLFAQVEADSVTGVVKSQTDPDLVYSCRLDSSGTFACCTQNLNPCGGLRGALCKHLLVLIVGLTRAGDLDATTVNSWVLASHLQAPQLDKDRMSEVFLKYKGAEAGEIDWRPTETVPEDYYAF